VSSLSRKPRVTSLLGGIEQGGSRATIVGSPGRTRPTSLLEVLCIVNKRLDATCATVAAVAEPKTILRCRVTPGAKVSKIVGWAEEGPPTGRVLRVKLKSPPVDGKANRELLAFLAKELGVAKSALRLRSGAKSRIKTVEISADVDGKIGA
jgi:uncharacterized protein (TIGR00251 family)